MEQKTNSEALEKAWKDIYGIIDTICKTKVNGHRERDFVREHLLDAAVRGFANHDPSKVRHTNPSKNGNPFPYVHMYVTLAFKRYMGCRDRHDRQSGVSGLDASVFEFHLIDSASPEETLYGSEYEFRYRVSLVLDELRKEGPINQDIIKRCVMNKEKCSALASELGCTKQSISIRKQRTLKRIRNRVLERMRLENGEQ